MKQQRIRVLVSGKVQGVFFRQALKVVAKKNNVSGWVRNLKDRRVEAVLEGDSKSINSFIERQKHSHHKQLLEYQEILEEVFRLPSRTALYCPSVSQLILL